MDSGMESEFSDGSSIGNRGRTRTRDSKSPTPVIPLDPPELLLNDGNVGGGRWNWLTHHRSPLRRSPPRRSTPRRSPSRRSPPREPTVLVHSAGSLLN